MSGIDWNAVFITAAGVFTLFVFGVLILICACLKIAGEISRREEQYSARHDPAVDLDLLEAELAVEFGPLSVEQGARFQ
jgi:hypothetical protein